MRILNRVRLDAATAQGTRDQRDHEECQTNPENDLGDTGSGSGDASESEDTGNESNDEENKC